MIKLRNISKSYTNNKSKKDILQNVNINFPQKGLVYLLGENGVGKSTLFNILLTKDLDYEGNYYFNNLDIKELKNEEIQDLRSNYISIITQESNLIKELNVYENILIAINQKNISRDDKEKIISESLKNVGLEGFEKRKINTLSGGEKQKVAIARAIIKKPKVLLADEISSNLDFETTNEIMSLIYELSKDYLVIMVTHDYSLVKEYPGKIYEIKDKTIKDIMKVDEKLESIKVGTSAKKKHDYRNETTIVSKLLLHKRLINILHIFVLSISLIIIMILISNIYSNKNKQSIKTLTDNGLVSIDLDTNNEIKDSDNIIKYKELNPIINVLNNHNIKRIMLIDDYINDFEIKGRLPNNRNEIILTNYYSIKANKSVDDLLNTELSFRINESIEDFKIVGIIITNYHELIEKKNSYQTSKIIDLNTDLFYNNIFVINEVFDEYQGIKLEFSSQNKIDSDGYLNNFSNRVSDERDILYGKRAELIDEIVLSYHNIPVFFEEYDSETIIENLENIYSKIKNKIITMYIFDYSENKFEELNLRIVGINKTNIGQNGVSLELLSRITKDQVINKYSFYFTKNFNLNVRNLNKISGTYELNSLISKNEFEPEYQNVNTILNLISTIALPFIIVLIGIIFIVTFMNINSQVGNIKTLKLIGYSNQRVYSIYIMQVFVILICSSVISFFTHSVIIKTINNKLINNNLQIKYTILFNPVGIIMILLILLIVITILMIYLLVKRQLRKA
ncbi:ABC transporter ATP-binding protein [Haploplasma axanthum]|uniref:ABC transporter ATPase n=1 Tax=Haploplasma axanthum TaxID=29552 RepID=A0A449BF44_HAPAX|nr:ATP-binding cassette domain-containing protein [Haploplasma axanthum]VEU81056.1 ABC transporter ATPase [Haploplasma axanthum]